MKKENVLLSLNGNLVYCNITIEYGSVKIVCQETAVFEIKIDDYFDRDLLSMYLDEVNKDTKNMTTIKANDYLYLGINISNSNHCIKLTNQFGELKIPTGVFEVILGHLSPLCCKDEKCAMAAPEESVPVIPTPEQIIAAQQPQVAQVAQVQQLQQLQQVAQPSMVVSEQVMPGQQVQQVTQPLTGTVTNGMNPASTPAVNAQIQPEVIRVDTPVQNPVQQALAMPAGTTPFIPNVQH